MRFDFANFILGFFAGVLVTAFTSLMLWRSRRRISAAQHQLEQQVGAARQFITNTAEGRYYGRLVEMLNAAHLAGDAVRLTEVYIEPRFLTVPPVHDPDDERPQSVFHVVPQIHDLPASYAPYNLETIGINELRSGERHLALLGPLGSGKTVALAVMGLVAAGEIEIPVIDLASDEVFKEEIKSLPPEEQARRIRQLEDMQNRAIAQVRSAQKRDDNDTQRPLIDLTTLLPIYVHLRDIDLRPESYGLQPGKTASLDPAEPLVLALRNTFGGIAANFLPRLVYERLTASTALVLVDGFDELPAPLQGERLAWLQRFIEIYSGNMIIVAGPEQGYDPLLKLGLEPIFLRAWNDADYDQFILRWTTVWPSLAKRGAKLPDEPLRKRVAIANRGRSPMDITLKVWAAYSGDEQEQGRRGWYDFYVRRALSGRDIGPALHKMAAAILSNNGLPLPRDPIKTLLSPTENGEVKLVGDDVVNKTLDNPLVVEWPDGSYSFGHALLGAFMAAEALDDAAMVSVANQPAWSVALPFAAIRLNMESAVATRLSTAPDLLYSNLFTQAHWMVDSPAQAPWRAEFFKRAASALVQTTQFPAIRERAMAALVTSRDKGVVFIFRQALRNPNPRVRQLACIGLGALGDAESIKEVSPLLNDNEPDVQYAAGLALGVIGSEAALDTMIEGLLTGEAGLRRAVAEALAAIPGVGHATLRDAINNEELEVRHAAVFGLARVRAGWALTSLYRALLEDGQWYVRNAAEQAFMAAQELDRGGVEKHPDADQLPWLIKWAAERGDGVPQGAKAREVLIRALQEADAPHQAAAAQTLARIGHVTSLRPLYGALRDQDENVRAAAFDALSNLQTRLGDPLPAVI